MNEQEIEQILKDRLQAIAPSESAFHHVMKQAASSPVEESPYMKASVSSPYQSHISTFMNKFALIGIPVAAVAVIAVMFLYQSDSPTPVAVSPAGDTAPLAVVTDQPVVNPSIEQQQVPVVPAATKTATVDDIVDGFLADANADAEFAKNDTTDQAYIDSELATVNTNTTLSYENII